MRSRRILGISAALAISTLGVGLASAEDNDRYRQYNDHAGTWDHDHHGNDCAHESHVRHVDYGDRDYRRPRAYVTRPYWRRYRPVRRAYRPFYNSYVPSRAERILYRNDMNGDGLITWWEARRNRNLRRHFNHIDYNRDGVLTLREMAVHYQH